MKTLLRALWRRLTGEPEAEAQPPTPASRVYARRHCARCGKLLAHTANGELSWAHFCSEGYGVVALDGTFFPREKRPTPILPIDSSSSSEAQS